MEQILNHNYKRDNYTYLLLNQIKENDEYFSQIGSKINNVNYKFINSTRLVLRLDILNNIEAIIQLESFMNVAIIKVLYKDQSLEIHSILTDVINYLVDTCRLIKLNYHAMNALNFKVYVYTSEKVNLRMLREDCEYDIFDTKLESKTNEYIFNFNFDQFFNLIPVQTIYFNNKPQKETASQIQTQTSTEILFNLKADEPKFTEIPTFVKALDNLPPQDPKPNLVNTNFTFGTDVALKFPQTEKPKTKDVNFGNNNPTFVTDKKSPFGNNNPTFVNDQKNPFATNINYGFGNNTNNFGTNNNNFNATNFATNNFATNNTFSKTGFNTNNNFMNNNPFTTTQNEPKKYGVNPLN